MTATIISNVPPFGAMTNQTVAMLFAVNANITRLQAAIAVASAGHGGTAGTEFEGDTNFGVLAGATPGAKGLDYRYALDSLATVWNTFWDAVAANIEALDNGVSV